MTKACQRVVSLVPSLTETVFELGLGNRLVGITRYCAEPAEAVRSVPKVGGTKNPDLERIAELRPDLVLVNSEENRQQDIGFLTERFPVLETMPRTLPEAAEVIRQLGERLQAMDAVEAVLLDLEAQMTRAEVESIGLERVRVFYPIWKKPWMTANRDTYIHDVLARGGAANVCAEMSERYPCLTLEEAARLDVELVLLPSEPFVFKETHRRELLESRVFGAKCRVLLVDGKDFCWHGSRSGGALGRVVDLLQPFRKQRV